MGALTDTRKRCLVDQHRLPIPLSDEATPPPFKKPKLFPSPPPSLPPSPPPPLPPSQNPSPPASPATSMPPRRYPPPAPFRRPVHAPQLNIRVLGLGSSATRSPRNLDSHGSPFSQFRFAGEERPAAPDKNVSLGLEEYKRLVVDVQEEHAQLAEAESPEAEAEAETTPVTKLTVVSRDPGEESDLYILDRKVDDGGKVVMESTPVREEPVSTRRSTPFYKELYENLSREHDSKLSSIAFEAKLLEKKRWSFSIVREALSLAKPKPKEDPRGPFTPLTDEEEAAVNHALRGGIRNEVLVVHKASNIEITREVMRCLRDCAWLNDEVINVYLELLKERETREPKRFLKCHFFNSFFYKKLISGKNGYDFKAIRRWTTQKKLGYSLIECDKIFVPIHKEVHWCLAVVNVKDKSLQYLDSLGGMDKTVLRVLVRIKYLTIIHPFKAKYLVDEVKDKSDRQIDTSSWRQEAVEDLPLQQNGWDCGMFMLKYSDFYSRGLGLTFGQEHMKYFRKRTIKEILNLRAE